jgi:uncharacterized membrane protein YidH (DUF202 family)
MTIASRQSDRAAPSWSATPRGTATLPGMVSSPTIESRPPTDPPNITNELPRERNREDADRTLPAWIRTSVAMIRPGFDTECLGQSATGLDRSLAGFSTHKTHTFGAALVAVGIAALAVILGGF